VYTLHELHARSSLEANIAQLGIPAVYGAIDVVRRALWCDDLACAHAVELPVFSQMHGYTPIEQLWMLAQLWSCVGSGRVRRAAFSVGATPLSDREAAGNTALLRSGLEERDFRVEVFASRGGRDDDGTIEWTVPLEVLTPDEVKSGQSPSAVLSPGEAPLEIGYTHASRTFWHLWQEGVVWRWPYGSELVWLIAAVNVENGITRLDRLSREPQEHLAALLATDPFE
jgi:hypothetical protein